MDPRIGIQVFNEFEDLVSLEWLERVAECTLSLAAPRSDCKGQECPAAMGPGADGAFTLGVVIADDDTVHRLNSQHRGLDEITDVLSFSFSHQGAYYGAEEQPSLALEDFEFVIPPPDRAQAWRGYHLLPTGGAAGGRVGPRDQSGAGDSPCPRSPAPVRL